MRRASSCCSGSPLLVLHADDALLPESTGHAFSCSARPRFLLHVIGGQLVRRMFHPPKSSKERLRVAVILDCRLHFLCGHALT